MINKRYFIKSHLINVPAADAAERVDIVSRWLPISNPQQQMLEPKRMREGRTTIDGSALFVLIGSPINRIKASGEPPLFI